ncbi:DUF2309 domain-containing protein [Maribacter cobaltidurans]|uniref:Probable inorganic carbon transporter subunit DabA n=1 Tax=Maribacter cobaltidurans TaxID=1178778 RepID=A0A223V239_9FLAO|nr:DUF2309 domain-containing protein [Maribacter cobaltidurans]ASV29307.1 DUF2309 domain-containing protein [Maribacter cobaltidurans]GGD70166.1 UPF0753 protein [Maribacter cobaltidurans]
MNQLDIDILIDKASEYVGNTWPLYSFVTSNPLNGFEKEHFFQATQHASTLLGADMFPKADVYKNALKSGAIDALEIQKILQEKGYSQSPEYYLELMSKQASTRTENSEHRLDQYMVKWLSSFMDEGLAEWQMPYKSYGFYTAWRKLATFDESLGPVRITMIPKTSDEALEMVLNGLSDEEIMKAFEHHLVALPGWTGYTKHRVKNLPTWQREAPITLKDYLAIRLWANKKLGGSLITNEVRIDSKNTISELSYLWLLAWEKSWQKQLLQTLKNSSIETSAPSEFDTDAQMVFCIDTRSELIRRHVENHGNYETFGYAGFFGIAMDYQNPKSGLSQKACPPILDSSYVVSEKAKTEKKGSKKSFDHKNEVRNFWNYFLKRMKNMLPSTFGFVEGSGFFYGVNLTLRTLFSKSVYRWKNKELNAYEAVCTPEIKHTDNNDSVNTSIPLAEKVNIVKSAFALMGWKNFAPLVIFVGHGSHSANNPFGSSLDCGACAATPGRHNARMLAKLANDSEVRKSLIEEHDIKIPETTLFVGAEHNTTTDEIVLFDSDTPKSHQKSLANLKINFKKAQVSATQERLGHKTNSVSLAQLKASNWGETRPEWGLAKNASFIIGPRKMTQNHNLEGRCFLHSYDWNTDQDGKSLEAIMQGPMVVTQWINNHYYFSTVDNDAFGAGTKTTHNVTGKFGVVQGNGGDLKRGLPWESLYEEKDNPYHPPLRLTVVINAPRKRVNKILHRNESLKSLITNEWLHLIIMDPETKSETLWAPSQLASIKEKYKETHKSLTSNTYEEVSV